MKRFYCTICDKMKRVRRLPSGVEAGTPGECRIHHFNGSRGKMIRDSRTYIAPKAAPVSRPKFTPSAPVPKKGKRTHRSADSFVNSEA